MNVTNLIAQQSNQNKSHIIIHIEEEEKNAGHEYHCGRELM